MRDIHTKDPIPLMTKKQLARHCGVSLRSIDNWMQGGVIPFRKVRKLVRFNLEDVEKALSRFDVPAKDLSVPTSIDQSKPEGGKQS